MRILKRKFFRFLTIFLFIFTTAAFVVQGARHCSDGDAGTFCDLPDSYLIGHIFF